MIYKFLQCNNTFHLFSDWSTTSCSTSRPSSRATRSKRYTRKSSWPSRHTQNRPSGCRLTKCFEEINFSGGHGFRVLGFRRYSTCTPLAWVYFLIECCYLLTLQLLKLKLNLLKLSPHFSLSCKYRKKIPFVITACSL